MGEIAENLIRVRGRIEAAANRCARDPAGIKLIAVSKTKTAEAIREAYSGGQRIFGENYVQELMKKADELPDEGIEWHFIGHLQRNKVRHVVPIVKCIHSLDSIRLAEEIDKRAERPVDCMVEVNLAGEASKTGISAGEAIRLIGSVRSMGNINLIGLMTMPPYDPVPGRSRPIFAGLRNMLGDLNEKGIWPRRLTELSMGMTDDLEVAIEEGSTMVRIGTAIFGTRKACSL